MQALAHSLSSAIADMPLKAAANKKHASDVADQVHAAVNE
jgi:hypothetical protein